LKASKKNSKKGEKRNPSPFKDSMYMGVDAIAAMARSDVEAYLGASSVTMSGKTDPKA
jgi:hypothetical protein